MDAFTLVVLACVGGEPTCRQSFFSEASFATAEACEAGTDAILARMTKEFGECPDLRGRSVEYEVSCLDRAQMLRIHGIAQSDA